MKKCINLSCNYYSDMRRNRCKQLPYRSTVELCECSNDDPNSNEAKSYKAKLRKILNKEQP